MSSTKPQILTLKIEGKECAAREGQTVLEVARENGIFIPTLCHLDGLQDIGACRLCVVELKGSPKLQPACVARVQEGMEVTVNNERLAEYRKLMVEMLFSERNHICSVCVSNGHCDLQDLAVKLGVTHIRIPYLHLRSTVDGSNDRFIADQNRCVLCMRCVRVCGDVEGAKTWNVMGRGADARVITDLNQPWGESETCTGCGKCVKVCPTGALTEKGKSAGEMAKSRQFLPYLTMMRGERL